MSLRIDATEWISGALLIGETGLGVLAENIPSTGTSGASYLYNDLSLPADNGKEICGRITAWPADGTLYAYEDGSFSFTGAPDGAYSFEYQLYVDGVATGATATVDLTIGVLTLRPGLLTNSNTFFAPVVSLASGPQTLAPELFSNTSSFFSPTVGSGVITHATTGALAAAGASITGSALRLTPGGGVYPDPADVRAGVIYGPTGAEFTGTMSILLDLNTGRLVKIIGQKVALLL